MIFQRLVFWLVVVTLLSGCWGRTEVNDLAFVVGSALDKKEDKLQLTYQIVVPAAMKEGGGTSSTSSNRAYVMKKAIGEDVHDSVEKIQAKLSRKIFVAHRKVLFIGEELAKSGVINILDQYGRDPESRLRSYVLVIKNGTGEEALGIPNFLEQFPSEGVREIEKMKLQTSVNLRDFYIDASSEGITPVLGVAEIKGDQSSSGENNERELIISGSAILKNYKLLGYLNDEQTRGLLWLKGKVDQAIIVADIADVGRVSLKLTKSSRKIKPLFFGDNHIKMLVKIVADGVIVENNTRLDLTNPENLEFLKRQLTKSLKERIEATVKVAQDEYQTDILGFGQEIYRHHPARWNKLSKDWDQHFSNMDINIDVKLTILRTGMSGAPLQLKEKMVK